MRHLRRQPEFREGARDMLQLAPGIAAWGLVTGVAMIKSGLSLPVALAMSFLVYAGSAQLAALPLMAAGASIWVVLATAACLNLRFVIFSTQWRPYFAHLPRRWRTLLAYFAADLNYVLFLKRYPEPRAEPGQWAYYWGGSVVQVVAWHALSVAGMLLADRVPTAWGLGFAGTVALLGMTVSLLEDRRTWAVAAVAAVVSVLAAGLPLRLNIVLAIAAAVALGLLLEHRPWQRPAPGVQKTGS